MFQRAKELRNLWAYVIGLTTTGDAIGRVWTLRRVIVSAVSNKKKDQNPFQKRSRTVGR